MSKASIVSSTWSDTFSIAKDRKGTPGDIDGIASLVPESSFLDSQSIIGLYLESQSNPKITSYIERSNIKKECWQAMPSISKSISSVTELQQWGVLSNVWILIGSCKAIFLIPKSWAILSRDERCP